MARRLVAALLAGFLVPIVAGCSLFGTPKPVAVPEPTPAPALTVENRGGPALSIRVNGAEVLQLDCNQTRSITPGVAGIPPLPWTVTVARIQGDVVVLSQSFDSLPRWILQAGETVPLLTGTDPPQGPPGPSCVP